MITYTADWRESCQTLTPVRKNDILPDECGRNVKGVGELKGLQRLERFADRHFSRTKRWAALTLAAVLTAGTVGGAWADVQTTETEQGPTSARESEHNQTETGQEQGVQETDQAQGSISQTESRPAASDTGTATKPDSASTESVPVSTESASASTESVPASTESASASTESVPVSTESDGTETAAFSEKPVAGSKETVQAETQPVSVETKGSADIQVVVRFDFRGLNPQTATYLATAADNPIKHYSVTITDQSTGQRVYSSDVVKRDTGDAGVLSLKPITVKADWDMGQPDPSTKEYRDVTKTYSVQVAVPHFKPLAEKTFTLKAYQAGWKVLPETEKESGKEENGKEENDKEESAKSETGSDSVGDIETPDPVKIPEFSWKLTADGQEGEEKNPVAMLTFVPQVDVDQTNLTPVSLTNLTRISRPYGKALEGGAITPGYVISSFLKPAGKTNPLVLLDKASYALISSQLADTDLGHSNGMTYVASRNEIYTTPVKTDGVYQIIVLDASTLKVKRRIRVDQYYNSISYDETRDVFFLGNRANSLETATVYSGDLSRKISSFHVPSNLTHQSSGTWNGLVYFTASEAGRSSMYEPVPDGRFRSGDNVIWIYDLYGNLLKTYYIPASSDGTHREIEAVMFDNGRMILQFNENGQAGYYFVNPEAAATTVSASVSVQNSYPRDGEFQAGLYFGGQRVASVTNAGGMFTFTPVWITQPGTYSYQIIQDKGGDIYNTIYSGETITVTVNALYDPFTNKLTLSSWYQGGSTIHNYRITKTEKKKITKVRKAKPAVRSLSAGKKKLKIRFRKVSYAAGYEIQVCRNKKFKGKTLKTYWTKKTSRTISKLTGKKRYYVRIRPYRILRGVTYYGKYSKTRSVKVR